MEGGNRYFDGGRYREAVIMYRNAIKVDPRFGEAYYRQALTLLRLQRLPECAHSLRRAVELLPEGPSRMDGRRRLGRLLAYFLEAVAWNGPTADEVLRLADDLRQQDPESFDAIFLEGKIHLLRARHLANKPSEADRELTNAVNILRRANKIRPADSEAAIALASALYGQKSAPEAIELLRRHTNEHPASAAAFGELARLLLETAKAGDAVRVLETGINKHPDFFDFRVSLARLYSRIGDAEGLRKLVTDMTALHQRFPAAFEVGGAAYQSAGLNADALSLYDRAIAVRPGQASAFRIMKVDALQRMGRRDEAEKLNRQVLALDPNNTDALIRQASFELDAGHLPSAIKLLERIVVLAPQNHLGQYNLGRALIRSGQLGLARQRLVEAVRLAPDFVEGRLELARLELSQGEYGRAVQSAEEILRREPGHVDAGYLRVEALRKLNKLPDAEAALKHLPMPGSSSALFELCQLRSAQGRLADAEAACRKSYDANNADLRGLVYLVESRLQRGSQREALALLDREAHRSPGSFGVQVLLADVASRTARNELAIQTYTSLLPAVESSTDRKAEILLRLGELHRRNGDLNAALPVLRQAYSLSPENPFALQNLAVALDMSGQQAEAMRLYERSLELYGQNSVVLNNLAFHLAESGGDLDRALTYAQRALQASPGTPEYLDTMGWIYLKKGLVAPAIDQFQELVRKHPNHPGFRYHLGAAHARRGDVGAARKELEAALKLNPSAGDAAAIRSLIQQFGS